MVTPLEGDPLYVVHQKVKKTTCSTVGGTHDAVDASIFTGSTSGTVLTSRFAAGARTWNAEFPESAIAVSSFANETMFGSSLIDTSIRVLNATKSGWDLMASGATVQNTVASKTNVIWSSFDSPNAQLHIYDGSGAKVLVSQPGTNAVSPDTSADKLVWIGTHGPLAGGGTYTSAEMYWSPLPSKPADVVVHKAASLTATRDLTETRTFGDYAAAIGCPGDTSRECAIDIVRLSTGKVWSLLPRPARGWSRLLAISASELSSGVGRYDEADQPLGHHQRRSSASRRARHARHCLVTSG